MLNQNKKELVKFIEKSIPIHNFLSLKVLELEDGYVKVSVPYRKEVVGDIRLNRWHGGIIATIMDSVGGITGWTHFTSNNDKLATIDIRVDYLKAAQASTIIVSGEIVRLGNRIMVTKMKAYQNEALISEGKAVYSFIRESMDK
ncbi:hotdog fold thioesterase [Marinicella rhabdoformis]|uniref:hotdog fold thioesterase n=1 Tax=Marinicella rhabdoformis TaxID=2580566 RepID=UPI0012AEB5B2|nr:hotdog fold thioesterase [Marinicella rhabdoformis]